MAFDNTIQKMVHLPGARLEFGLVAFVTSGVTLEVPTKLKKITGGFGMTLDNLCVKQDATITNGCVTFTRESGGTSAIGFNYILFGY